MPLIDINIAKKHLRIDSSYEDDLIGLYLEAAESSAAKYLNRKLFASDEEMETAVADGSAGDEPMVANAQVGIAILLTLTDLYEYRGNTVAGVTVVELPQGAVAYLHPFRVNMGT
jgi:hypothetical protein